MRPRVIIFTSLIFVACMALAIDVTSVAMRGRHVVDLAGMFAKEQRLPEIKLGKACSTDPLVKNLPNATNTSLQRLAEFQDVCQSGQVRTMMLFTDMPKDLTEAQQKAKDMAGTLKEFDTYKVRPLVIIEPVASWGFVDFNEFRDGFYDAWITEYFATLKAQGITDQQMGIWTPFPEPNLPYWNHQSAKPEDFGLMVNRYLRIMDSYFPTAKASIMLNSASYDNSDFEWSNEEYVSLLPYLKNLDPKLIDMFGMQGFPWSPRNGTGTNNQFDASTYLNADLLTEAAATLGIKEVWLNTASFMQKYTLDNEATVTISPETRKTVLSSIVDQTKRIQAMGYTVSVNLFAEDKSSASEETNWSYWAKGQQRTSQHALVYQEFAADLERANVDLWLFDR
jgi:hypothetical protein